MVTQCYVDKFGREGASADFDWMLAAPRLFLPDLSPVTPRSNRWIEDETGATFVEGFRQAERFACKAEVERFLQNPEMFRRYYKLTSVSQRYVPARAG